MKILVLFIFALPLLAFSQSIDVFVVGTTIEFSGGTYNVNTSNAIEVVDLRFDNNTGIEQSWKLERILPITQFWDDVFMTWSTPFDVAQNANYLIDQTPSWISSQPITLPDGEVIYTILRFDEVNAGCDLFQYYILNNDVRVDSFSINLCKTVGLDEINSDNISIYPNPSNSKLNLSFENQVPNEINLFDLLGNKIATFDASKDMNISTEKYSNGIYFLSWEIGEMNHKKKFQVQH